MQKLRLASTSRLEEEAEENVVQQSEDSGVAGIKVVLKQPSGGRLTYWEWGGADDEWGGEKQRQRGKFLL